MKDGLYKSVYDDGSIFAIRLFIDGKEICHLIPGINNQLSFVDSGWREWADEFLQELIPLALELIPLSLEEYSKYIKHFAKCKK